MATGWHSFSDKVAAVIHDAVGSQQGAVVSAHTLPPGLGNIIAKATQVDRNLRYQSAAEMRADLERIRTETAAPSPKETVKTPNAIATAKPRRWKWPVSAAAAALALSAIGYYYFHRAPKLTEKDTIVLADFANTTGDPVFDGTLRQGLAVQLEQSPFLSLISEAGIQKTLRLMGQPPEAKLTPEVAREVCERTASAAVLEGSIASLGSQYVLGLRARDCRTGSVVDDEQVQTARKEDVLNSLTQIASKFRTRAGESLVTVAKHDTPLAEATTPSLEALKAYSTGCRVNFSNGSAAAVPFLKRAIEIDPQFAMAYAYLGRMYGDIGESVLSAESTTRAYQLRDRTSERERFFIIVTYHRQVTGNLPKAREALESWAQTYPRDVGAHSLLSGFTSQGTANYERAIEEANKTIALDPDQPFAYANWAYGDFYLDRLDEAEKSIQRATERKLELPDLLLLRFHIAFLRGDRPAMEREMALSRAEPGAEDWVTHSEALVLARSGQLQKARTMSQRAVDLAEQAGQQERAATYITGKAVWEAFYGNAPESRRDAMAALEISKGRDVAYSAAFALALSGDFSRSQALADDLEKRFPEDTSVRFNYLPALRGVFALRHGEPQKALELLQSNGPYEFAVPGIAFFAFFGSLYPTYVRGEAYLALHQGAAAATEFQKILDHRGLVLADPVGALAHLQIGRAYAMQGDTAKAKAAYQDFLTLWKDADPDIPVFKQAKAEYAKLQ